MAAESLTPCDKAAQPPALLPAGPALVLDPSSLSEAPSPPAARQAYLFRRCQAHPLRQLLAEHRGVRE